MKTAFISIISVALASVLLSGCAASSVSSNERWKKADEIARKSSNLDEYANQMGYIKENGYYAFQDNVYLHKMSDGRLHPTLVARESFMILCKAQKGDTDWISYNEDYLKNVPLPIPMINNRNDDVAVCKKISQADHNILTTSTKYKHLRLKNDFDAEEILFLYIGNRFNNLMREGTIINGKIVYDRLFLENFKLLYNEYSRKSRIEWDERQKVLADERAKNKAKEELKQREAQKEKQIIHNTNAIQEPERN